MTSPSLTMPNDRTEADARATMERRDRASWFAGRHASGEFGIISGRDGREVGRFQKQEDRDAVLALMRGQNKSEESPSTTPGNGGGVVLREGLTGGERAVPDDVYDGMQAQS